MLCDERERLLAEYRAAVADLTSVALEVAARDDVDSGDMRQRKADAIAASAKARLDLREHLEEHRCGTYSAWSALHMWHAPRTTVKSSSA